MLQRLFRWLKRLLKDISKIWRGKKGRRPRESQIELKVNIPSENVEAKEVKLNEHNAIPKEINIAADVTSSNLTEEIEPDDHEAWSERVAVLGDLGRYEEAITSCDRALTLKPDDYKLWYFKGITLANLGRYEEAIAAYGKAVAIEPENHQAWYNRGTALGNLGRYEEAITSYGKALALKPENHQAWHNRGTTLANLGRYEEAIAAYGKALAIEPDLHESWHNRGITLEDLGRYEEAITSYGKALALKPDLYQVWNDRGIALKNLGRYEEAIASYGKALALKPDYHEAWNNRGIALGILGKNEEAIISFNRALALKPDYHEAWFNRSIIVFQSFYSFKVESGFAKNFEFEFANNKFILLKSFDSDEVRNFINQPISSTLREFISSTANLPNRADAEPKLNQRGYDGVVISLVTGLKYCPDLYSQGFLYLELGNRHSKRSKLGQETEYKSKAESAYTKALENLQNIENLETNYQYLDLYLQVLVKNIEIQLYFENANAATVLKTKGVASIRRFQDANPQQSTAFRNYLIQFNQLTVDQYIQAGNITEAILLAETDKNLCLAWLLNQNPDSQSLTPEDINKLLKTNNAIIYWHLSSIALTRFVLIADQPISPSFTPVTNFETWADTWKTAYQTYEGTKEHPWRTQMPANLQALAQILEISKLEADLQTKHPQITNLILIPHRDLHLFPIQSLFSANFQISYLPSLQFGLLNSNQDVAIPNQTSPKFLSIKNPKHTSPTSSKKIEPLPLAEIESDLNCAIFNNAIAPNFTAIVGTNAYKSVIQTQISHHSLLNFTGHAYFDFDQPINSALLLKGTDTLTLKDIAELDLSPYFLVLLSGCETGITGKQTIVHEYIGLNSIFMYSGANCVISTLWTVPSAASALLSIRFYQNYFEKHQPAITALNNAQSWLKKSTIGDLISWIEKLPDHDPFAINTLLQAVNEDSIVNIEINDSKPPYHHPYYWASFIITGS